VNNGSYLEERKDTHDNLVEEEDEEAGEEEELLESEG